MPVVSVCPGFKGNWDFNDFSGLYQVFEERNGGLSILNLANLFFLFSIYWSLFDVFQKPQKKTYSDGGTTRC